MRIKKTSILLLILFTILNGLLAQQIKSERNYIIHLKNGSSLIGVLLQYGENQPTIIKMGDGEEIIVPNSAIVRIELTQNRVKKSRIKKAEKVYEFKESGWQAHGNFGVLSNGGNITRDGLAYVFDIGLTYQLDRKLGIGLNVGLDNYNTQENLQFIPIYMTISGYLTATSIAPFYSVGVGYGFSEASEDILQNEERKGGLMLYPKIGLRLSGGSGLNAVIFAGLKIQKSNIHLPINCGFIDEGCPQFIERNRTLQRILIGAGFVF